MNMPVMPAFSKETVAEEMVRRGYENFMPTKLTCHRCQRCIPVVVVKKWGYQRFEFPEQVATSGSDRIDEYRKKNTWLDVWCASCTKRSSERGDFR